MGSEMKLYKLDVANFMEAVDKCKGNVYLETSEGDSLNLKSKLTQLMGLSRLIEGGIIVEASIRCELPEDESKLFRFALYNEMPKAD